MIRQTQSLKDKYEKFVIRKDGCWDWSGCYNKTNKSVQFWSEGKTQRGHLVSLSTISKILCGVTWSHMEVKH